MRLPTALIALLLGGCLATEPLPAIDAASPSIQEVRPTWEVGPSLARSPLWAGHEATRSDHRRLAARAAGPLEVYSSPKDAEPMLTLEPTTILGTPTVLAALGEPEEGLIEVIVPGRPNGRTGWVRTDEVWLYVVDGHIVVDLSERRLWYMVDGEVVVETEIGVGSDRNRTPVGEFFVTDSVTLADPNSAWGPHALGLSARSETITFYNGGDGIIGIHGTNSPGSIGEGASLGCVRVPNEVITKLHGMVPLGTRVTIRD